MYCHKAVRSIAKEMAGTAYEELAKKDGFYEQWPNQNLFITKHWKFFVGAARQSLLSILSGGYPEAMKNDALDIYIKDRVLQDVQTGVPVNMGQPVGNA